MKITRLVVYQVDIPHSPTSSLWMGKRAPALLDSTIVEVQTDRDVRGHGETCPVGSVYLPSYAKGARAALGELAPAVIGRDPREIARINDAMDAALLGHEYVKSAIDIACWDILGKSTGLPLHTLLGGRCADSVPLCIQIPAGESQVRNAIDERRAKGYKVFQMKVGTGTAEDIERIRAAAEHLRPDERLIADANRAWTRDRALHILQSIQDLPCLIEQPCASYDECLSVRRRTMHPFLLDEVIDNAGSLLRAIADDALDGLVVKLSHAGGLSRAMLLRDICIAAGLPMRIEDTAGTEFIRAATGHLALATPPRCLISGYPFENTRTPTADGAPEIRDGHFHLSDEPGLGLRPDYDALGKPLLEFT